MIALVIGAVEISDAFTIKRKVAHATSSLGDLLTRTKAIGGPEMDDIFKAAGAVIAPYPPGHLHIKVACVRINEERVVTVRWAKALNDTSPQTGSTIAIPSGVSLPGSSLVLAEVRYDYLPPIGSVLTGDIKFSDVYYLKPRGGQVEYKGTPC